MKIQLSTKLRAARANIIEATVGPSPKIRIFDGTMPSAPAAADAGTKLAELDLPADWMTQSTDGIASKTGAWQDLSCDASGNAAYWRLYDAAGACHMQGDISDQAGTGAMKVTTVAFTQGLPFTILTFGWVEADA